MALSIFGTILITIVVLYAICIVCELITIYVRQIVLEELEQEKRRCKQKREEKREPEEKQNVFDKKSFEELFKSFMEQQDEKTTVL